MKVGEWIECWAVNESWTGTEIWRVNESRTVIESWIVNEISAGDEISNGIKSNGEGMLNSHWKLKSESKLEQ